MNARNMLSRLRGAAIPALRPHHPDAPTVLRTPLGHVDLSGPHPAWGAETERRRTLCVDGAGVEIDVGIDRRPPRVTHHPQGQIGVHYGHVRWSCCDFRPRRGLQRHSLYIAPGRPSQTTYRHESHLSNTVTTLHNVTSWAFEMDIRRSGGSFAAAALPQLVTWYPWLSPLTELDGGEWSRRCTLAAVAALTPLLPLGSDAQAFSALLTTHRRDLQLGHTDLEEIRDALGLGT